MIEATDIGGTALRAGQAATELGVGVQTLHYYEREGLISPPPRSKAGYRLYPPELLERLRFIRRAQALGLSLAEIKQTLKLAAIGKSPCGRVQNALAERLREVDRRLEELTAFRSQLAVLVEKAPRLSKDAPRGTVCAIVEGSGPTQRSELVNVPLRRRGRAPGTNTRRHNRST